MAALLLAGGCKPAPREAKAARDDTVPVTVAEVELVDVEDSLPVYGSLFARNEAEVSARVEGQIEKTLVDFGARVKAGQELALIDTASYEALANQAAANVSRAGASATNAEQTLRRMQELQASKISSASELDAANAQAAQARAELRAVEAAQAIVKLNLEHSRVLAPFDAAVAERLVTMGDYVKIGSPLYRLVEDSELKFIVQAPERYAGSIVKGQTVRFSVDAHPGTTFEGKVYLISPEVSTATRGFNVGALVRNKEGLLKASSFARGELIMRDRVPTPLVPYEAIVNFAGVTKVYVIADGAARSRNVRAGRILGTRQEVLEGLRQGELVAISGQTKLFEGAKVRVQKSAREQPSSAAAGN